MPDPESFKGKVLLLVVDKIIIGAIIATAFFVYDQYKTTDTRRYERQRVEIQRSFERSRLIKEFLPVVQDESINLTTRAYVLRAAVLTHAIDPDAAFELGQDFFRKGLGSVLKPT